MCVIIVKAAGIELPENMVRQSIDDNPDGWGVARAIKGKLVIDKGMNTDEFVEFVMAIPVEQQAIIHTRLATAGKTDTMNCHPFKISPDVCIMHNGRIEITRPYSEMSDTWHFSHGIIKPLLKRHPELYGTEEFKTLIEAGISNANTNKVVMMNRQGKILIFNRHLGYEYQGLWLSNSRSLWGKHFGTNSPKDGDNNYDEKVRVFQQHGVPVNANYKYCPGAC